VSETEHLPDRNIKSDTELAIEAYVDSVLELHPNLDREELHNKIRDQVQEYVPDADEGAEEEENGVEVTAKAKGLAKETVGAVTRDEEMKAEGRLERGGRSIEGNKAYFRSVIEETNKRAAGDS
jgi:hypothetical protein